MGGGKFLQTRGYWKTEGLHKNEIWPPPLLKGTKNSTFGENWRSSPTDKWQEGKRKGDFEIYRRENNFVKGT